MLVLRAADDELLLKKDGVCILVGLILVIETAAVNTVLTLDLVDQMVVELLKLAVGR